MDAHLSEAVRYLAAQSWQVAVLTAVVAAVTFALRHHSAHIRYLLWLTVLAKCFVPPVYTVPLRILPVAAPELVPSALPSAIHSGEYPTSSGLALVGRRQTEPSSLVARRSASDILASGWLGIVWLLGAGGYLMTNLLRALRGQLWLRTVRRPIPDSAQADIADLLRVYRMRRLPRIWMMEGIGQPFVWGLARGSIYVPPSLLSIESPAHRRSVLGHELSHVLRFDAAINTFQVVAQALFWFHPLVWWANQKIRREREKCCDEMAVARLGATPKEYSAALVNTLIQIRESPRPVPSLAIAGPLKNTEERIRTMLKPGREFYKRPSLPSVAVVALAALLAVPTTVVLTVRAANQSSTGSVTSDSPFNLGPTVNGGDYEWDPCISADGLSLYFLSRRPGGLGDADIWVTTRKEGDDPWGTPVNLGSPINSAAFEGAPCLSADGLEFYFTSNRPGGCGGYDLWVSERPTTGDAWRTPVNLGPAVNSPLSENGPSISGDSLSLYFSEHVATESRPGGLGGADIWVTTRKSKNDPWGIPVNLGPTVNSPSADSSPSISPNGLSLFFMSDRPGFGKTDIWVTTRMSQRDPWGLPVNLGPPINTADGEWNPVISADGSILYFASGRDGSARTDIWAAGLTTRSQTATDGDAGARLANLLYEAAKAGDLEEVRRLIAERTSVNSTAGDEKSTPLHAAASEGHAQVVKALLEAGANVNAGDSRGCTPLYRAIWSGDEETVGALISAGADVNRSPAGDYPPLVYAIWQAKKGIVERLLNAGADINTKDEQGYTPLYWAAFTSVRNVLDLVVSKKNWPDTIHLAACKGQLKKVTTLMEDGANVNAKDEFGCAPLHWASLADTNDVADFLMAQGADVNARDNMSFTPLMAAHRAGMVALLISRGADVNAKVQTHGRTCLHMSCYAGEKARAELLIARGADIEARDNGGATPLRLAAGNGQKDIVELLLKAGADVNATDNQGRTPLSCTEGRYECRRVAELLRQHGAKE